jgi:hypothetical protein
VTTQCEKAEDLIFAFDDSDGWQESDQLAIRPEANSKLNKDGACRITDGNTCSCEIHL